MATWRFSTMRFLRSQALSAALVLCVAGAPGLASAAAAARSAPQSDPRERAPAALLGVWKADIAASGYGANPPREHFRSFQYTEDGKVMVHFGTITAGGQTSHGHWSLQLDGSPGYEYLSTNGSMPLAEIRVTKVDERTLNLTNSTHGKIDSTARYEIAQDGKTLTLVRNPGAANETRIVYRKWGAQ
jgi:hypothetical protein